MSRPQTGGAQIRFGPMATPRVIKHLLIATAVVFLIQRVVGIGGGMTFVERYGALDSSQFFTGMVWQPLTRLLLHAEFWHLAGNMFILWMFGSSIAEQWGYKRFMWLYLGAGAAGGVIQASLEGLLYILGWKLPFLVWAVPSLGASGAAYTLIAMFALMYPRRPINLLFIPLEFDAIWLIPMSIGADLGFGGPGISHEAHMIGLALGWVVLKFWTPNGRRRGSSKPPPAPKRPTHLRVVGDDGPTYH